MVPFCPWVIQSFNVVLSVYQIFSRAEQLCEMVHGGVMCLMYCSMDYSCGRIDSHLKHKRNISLYISRPLCCSVLTCVKRKRQNRNRYYFRNATRPVATVAYVQLAQSRIRAAGINFSIKCQIYNLGR